MTTRLARLFLAVLTAVTLASSGAKAWLEWNGGSGLSLMQRLDLQRLTRWVGSKWFYFALAALGVNLLIGMLATLPKAWSSLFDHEQGARRFGPMLRLYAHLSLLAALAGGALMWTEGFRAKAWIEEGVRTGALEFVGGKQPAGWTSYRQTPGVQHESESEGKSYVTPGFEIERVGEGLRFYESGNLVHSLSLSPGKPGFFGDFSVHLLRYAPGSTEAVVLTVTERKTKVVREIVLHTKGEIFGLEDFSVRLVEIQQESELNSPAVQLEYREGEGQPERFWVFTQFPDYDFAHRKGRAQNFTLEKVRRHEAAEIQIGSQPGANWLFGGLFAMSLFFWLSLLLSGTADLEAQLGEDDGSVGVLENPLGGGRA